MSLFVPCRMGTGALRAMRPWLKAFALLQHHRQAAHQLPPPIGLQHPLTLQVHNGGHHRPPPGPLLPLQLAGVPISLQVTIAMCILAGEQVPDGLTVCLSSCIFRFVPRHDFS